MGKASVTVESINAELKAAKVGISILRRGDRLYLQGTFPPRPGSVNKVRQIALGMNANEWGLPEARALAFAAGADLARHQWDWGKWGNLSAVPTEAASVGSCGHWIDRYRQHIESRLDGDEKQKALLWRKRYWNPALQHLPARSQLNEVLLLRVVERYKPNSRSRQLACQILQAFGRWAGLEISLREYSGNYSVNSVEREIPTDEEIEAAIDAIQNPQWKRVAALLATYGLRDHEAWHTTLHWVEDSDLGLVLEARVGIHTKTGKVYGERMVLPFHPQWVRRWGLDQIDGALPKQNPRINQDLGERTSRQFKRYKVPFTPYTLRHAWCIRGAVIYGIPIPVMAQMAGNDAALFMRTYNKHLSADQKRAAYRTAIATKKARDSHGLS